MKNDSHFSRKFHKKKENYAFSLAENSSLDESHVTSMNAETPDAEEASASGSWRPLLLIIPLRLGLTTINKVYLPAVQVFSSHLF